MFHLQSDAAADRQAIVELIGNRRQHLAKQIERSIQRMSGWKRRRGNHAIVRTKSGRCKDTKTKGPRAVRQPLEIPEHARRKRPPDAINVVILWVAIVQV